MPLSLKWQIQLWYVLILAATLTFLGMGFFFYEKTQRLDAVEDQLDNLLHPTIGPLEQSLRSGRRGEHRGARRNLQPAQLQEPSFDESIVAATGGWKRRERNQDLVPSKPLQTDTSSLPPQHQDLEENFVPLGYYARAERYQGGSPSFQTSNFPDLELPKGLGRGVFFRLREGRYREAYHRMPMFHVLVGVDLSELDRDLNVLKGQIAGGAVSIFGLGMLVGYALVSRSLKPLERFEAVAAEIADGNLSQRVPTRTKFQTLELQRLSENLNHTFSQLEEAFDKQIRFTANASHELRTPLTALLAQIEHGLKRSRTDEEYNTILTVCRRSSKRIQKITEQLIELSRYDSGKVQLDLEEVELEPMLVSLVEELQPYVQEYGHELATDIKPVELSCDPFRLEQVITNLINNAVQHNTAPMRITLRSRTEGDSCVIEVIDTGKGIYPDNLEKLFDRFFQESVSRTKTEKKSNVGLGLAISQAIVRTHRGRIEVESEQGRETVFRIILPMT